RIELAEGGLQQKMAKLENSMASDQADLQLAEMKAQMGLSAPVTEDPLARLKAEIAEDNQAQPVQNKSS
ncbi:MAG TPA: hypothetical protein VK689_11065, partial [Armatimonadota bacterium]|nr:hypothetical protein [Armatimonadota bacterium]